MDRVGIETPWQAAGASVIGAAHRRKQMPNQDALGWWTSPDANAAILAVADGHGDPRSHRSAEGAALAITAAIDCLQSMLTSGEAIDEDALRALPRAIVEDWRRRVLAHLRATPLPVTDDEEPEGELAAWDPYLVYGTTLLAAAVLPGAVMAVQIGDGDILFVSGSGEVTRPLPRDARLLANDTTSLCGANAEGDFQVALITAGEMPALILAATDGYANSFPDDASFLQVGSDLLGLIRGEGIDAVTDSLPGWLEETSNRGSGDDTTLGMLWRKEPT